MLILPECTIYIVMIIYSRKVGNHTKSILNFVPKLLNVSKMLSENMRRFYVDNLLI